ncbi:hypothetical protein ASG82_18700 [Mycobacterium sp. Soil538]|nr:hypothetical protein ASG82_18700 [Mycobacterium sp. Soil538]
MTSPRSGDQGLAGALSFNLAGPESRDNRPVFAQLMLDEAFSKSDPGRLRKRYWPASIAATLSSASGPQIS